MRALALGAVTLAAAGCGGATASSPQRPPATATRTTTTMSFSTDDPYAPGVPPTPAAPPGASAPSSVPAAPTKVANPKAPVSMTKVLKAMNAQPRVVMTMARFRALHWTADTTARYYELTDSIGRVTQMAKDGVEYRALATRTTSGQLSICYLHAPPVVPITAAMAWDSDFATASTGVPMRVKRSGSTIVYHGPHGEMTVDARTWLMLSLRPGVEAFPAEGPKLFSYPTTIPERPVPRPLCHS